MVMLKGRTALISAGLLFSLAGLNPAQADVPAALDRVPSNAALVVAVNNLQQTKARFDKLGAKFDVPVDQRDDGPIGMANKFLGMEGLKKDGSLAFAVLPNADGTVDMDAPEEEQRMIVILPVSNYSAFSKALGAEDAHGTASITIDDNPAFLKDIGGGYAIMGPMKELIDGFEGKGGNMASHAKMIGKSGRDIAENSDIIMVISVPAMRTQIEQGVQGLKDQAEGMGAAIGEQGAQAAAMMGIMQGVAEAFARDGQAGIIGWGMGEDGVSMDFGAQFKEDTSSAKMFSKSGDAAKFLGRVPNQPFLFATSIDLSSPAIKGFMKDMQKVQTANPMMAGMGGNMVKQIDNVDGMSFVMGANKGGIMGLLANTVTFVSTSQPKAYLKDAADAAMKMNGKEIEGINFTVDYKAASQDVGGVKADTWTMTMEPGEDNPNAGMIGMMQQVFFGPGGMGGMSAAVDNGVVSTMSQNTPLFTSAIDAAKSGNGLSQDEGIRSVQKFLPKNRTMEMYLGTKSIMEAMNAAMGMMGGGMDLKVPAKVSPIGMGAGIDSGGIDFRIFVPADVITTLSDTMKAMKAGEAEGGDEMDGGNDTAPSRF